MQTRLVPILLYKFSPANIAGLQLWLAADGTVYQNSNLTTAAVADGDPVGAWVSVDPIPNTVTQATSGSRPTLKLNIQNTKPAVLFGSTWLFNLMGSWYANGFTGFAVVNVNNTSGSKGIIASNAANNLSCCVSNSTLGYFKQFIGGFVSDGTLVQGTAAIATWYGPDPVGGTPPMYAAKNNGSFASGNATSGITATTGVSIGGYTGGADPFNGYIMEVILYNNILSSNQIATVQQYLNSKWGVY